MHHDSQAYYLRLNDTWKKIDYSKPAATWMEPVKRGETTGMVEIPVNWEVSGSGVEWRSLHRITARTNAPSSMTSRP
jgi:hypothetical protein